MPETYPAVLQVSNGDILILVVKYDGEDLLDAAGKQALSRIGVSPNLKHKESLVLISIKGSDVPLLKERKATRLSSSRMGVHAEYALDCGFEISSSKCYYSMNASSSFCFCQES